MRYLYRAPTLQRMGPEIAAQGVRSIEPSPKEDETGSDTSLDSIERSMLDTTKMEAPLPHLSDRAPSPIPFDANEETKKTEARKSCGGAASLAQNCPRRGGTGQAEVVHNDSVLGGKNTAAPQRQRKKSPSKTVS